MSARRPMRFQIAAVIAAFASLSYLHAQVTAPLPVLTPNLARISGTDTASNIAYTRLILSSTPTLDLTKPTLIAECTRDRSGKFRFNLFVNFGNIFDTAFHAPWSPSPRYPERPPVNIVNMTMEFLGYVKEKPVTRQFEVLRDPVGQFRYNSPGVHSHNLEEFSYYLQYLRALPTLRITSGTQTADFLTDHLLVQLQSEPLCRAASL